MKISKLFHWLYALVMFLPILFFIPNVFYYAFNEHAVNESSTEVDIEYKYQSNIVTSVNDLIEGNIYYLDELTLDSADITFYTESAFNMRVLACSSFGYNNADFYTDEIFVSDFDSRTYNGLDFYIVEYQKFSLNAFFTNENCYISLVSDMIDSFYLNDIVFVYYQSDYQYFIDTYNVSLPQYTDYNVIEEVEVNTDVEQTITQKVYYGWQSVWSLPVFSWSSNTFFSTPFNYISGLFGFQSGNTLSNCLSYWFSISVIWLVFDLMIYVPLLVHRWLDKASLE